MERDATLDEEISRKGAALFDWEVNSIQKRREWEERQLALAPSRGVSRQSPEQAAPVQGLLQSLLERFKKPLLELGRLKLFAKVDLGQPSRQLLGDGLSRTQVHNNSILPLAGHKPDATILVTAARP